MFSLNATAVARFWPKVDKTGECWLWTARRDSDGYGRFRPDGANTSDTPAHRVAFVMAGDVIPEGMQVCHTCDNPPCVRREHLFLGWPRDNTHDMMRKGRHRAGNTTETAARGERHALHMRPELAARGEENGAAKLTEDDVRAIRALAGRYSQAATGRIFGVTQETISAILRRKTWRHI